MTSRTVRAAQNRRERSEHAEKRQRVELYEAGEWPDDAMIPSSYQHCSSRTLCHDWCFCSPRPRSIESYYPHAS